MRPAVTSGLLVLGILLALAGARPASAQIQIGTVAGTLRDESGGVLEGVEVTLADALSGYRQGVRSSGDGRFLFHNVPFRAYTLRAERAGFSPETRAVSVRSNVPVELDL